jgi:PKHD-type hydroxylase
MNYGLLWKEVVFNRKAMDIVNKATNAELTWHQGKIHNSLKDNRSSNVAWIGDQDLLSMLLRMVKKINKDARWNLNITGVEAVQYGIYGKGDFYDWHVDQHPRPVRGVVRKISMTLFLNDDYEGGDFDLEIYRPDADPRYKTFKLKSGSAIFFQGDQWHRVRPVTSGLRKSLVAWFYGPPYS